MILAGDIGGTKSWLALFADNAEVAYETRLASGDYAHFYDLLNAFFAKAAQARDLSVQAVSRISLGVAGPVQQGPDGAYVAATNLPWRIESKGISEQFQAEVSLYNDLIAVGFGAIEAAADRIALNATATPQIGSAVVLAAGTGLGAAMFHHHQQQWLLQPSEAGHIDFAPVDDQQIALLDFLREQYRHVSYERILSGDGFARLYRFCSRELGQPERLDLTCVNANAQVTQAALQHRDPAAIEAVALFSRIMGAKAGNLALANLPWHGVYLAGNISGVIAPFLEEHFMPAFVAKGRFVDLMQRIPVYITPDPRLGLVGAYRLA